MPAIIMWKTKIEQERVARQIGEVEQQRQRDQVEDDLQEDVPLDVALAARLALGELEQQVVADHRAADQIQRQRIGDHAAAATR